MKELKSESVYHRGVARIYQRGGGGVTLSNIIVIVLSPRNIVGCFLKKGLQTWGHGHSRTPSRYALVPFCSKNEMESKRFIKKLNTYTKWNFNFFIIWQTRKIESIFKLKDKNIHPSHIIYKGTCNCGQNIYW